jgi:hypothetical protein
MRPAARPLGLLCSVINRDECVAFDDELAASQSLELLDLALSHFDFARCILVG